MFELISAVIRYFAGIREQHRINYQSRQPLCQADATSILFVNDFRLYTLSSGQYGNRILQENLDYFGEYIFT